MNILQAYLKYNSQLIIAISGMVGCGKNTIGSTIAKLLNINCINQYNYIDLKKVDETPKIIINNIELNNIYNDDIIDWEKFNNDINNEKANGLIIVIYTLPDDKIHFTVDYHIHLKMSKALCIERRSQFLEKHKDEKEFKEDYNIIGTETEKIILNKYIYPYYSNSLEKMKINKFININELSHDQIIDTIWDTIINFIQQYIDSFNKYKYYEWIKTHSDVSLSNSSSNSSKIKDGPIACLLENK